MRVNGIEKDIPARLCYSVITQLQRTENVEWHPRFAEAAAGERERWKRRLGAEIMDRINNSFSGPRSRHLGGLRPETTHELLVRRVDARCVIPAAIRSNTARVRVSKSWVSTARRRSPCRPLCRTVFPNTDVAKVVPTPDGPMGLQVRLSFFPMQTHNN